MGKIVDVLMTKVAANKRLEKIAKAREALKKQAWGNVAKLTALGTGLGAASGAGLGAVGGAAHHVVAPNEGDTLVDSAARGTGRGAMYGAAAAGGTALGAGMLGKAVDLLSKMKGKAGVIHA